jgi:hypothetical protein
MKITLKILSCLLLVNSISSCSTTQHANYQIEIAKNKKPINRARRALDKKLESSQRQFAFVNNQIIIFENN